MIDGTCHAIELDTCGPANYLLSNNLKKELNENEVYFVVLYFISKIPH